MSTKWDAGIARYSVVSVFRITDRYSVATVVRVAVRYSLGILSFFCVFPRGSVFGRLFFVFLM